MLKPDPPPIYLLLPTKIPEFTVLCPREIETLMQGKQKNLNVLIQTEPMCMISVPLRETRRIKIPFSSVLPFMIKERRLTSFTESQ